MQTDTYRASTPGDYFCMNDNCAHEWANPNFWSQEQPVDLQARMQQDGLNPPETFGHQASAQYADMLSQWLQDLDPKPSATPHHDSEANIAYQPPVSPSNDPPYWPAGHVPDWADPMAEGRTASEELPAEETTDGDWLSEQTDRLIEGDLTPEQYDAELDAYEASQRLPQAPWLERLVD